MACGAAQMVDKADKELKGVTINMLKELKETTLK